jgi:hypothetical protein
MCKKVFKKIIENTTNVYKNFKKVFKKDKPYEPAFHPYLNCDRVVLHDDIEHQHIGGRTAYIERYVTIDDILEKLLNFNIAAVNFSKRRPDLFRDVYDVKCTDDKLVKRKARNKNMSYYYVKVFKQNENNKNGTWLGYFIASDEFDDIIKKEKVV